MNKQLYLDYIKAAVAEGRKTYDASIEHWKRAFNPEVFLGMYTPPGNIALLAQTEGFLFHVTGEREYGEEAKRHLLSIDGFQSIVPQEVAGRHPEYARGIPAFDPLFQGTHYLHGYLYLKGTDLLNAEETERIEDSIRSAIRAMLHYPEWGAHNRSMLRVFALSLSITALGDTEETREWAKLRDYLAEESYGRWSIEDAELYLPLWLYSCIIYAKHTGRESDYYSKPQTKYYFDFITRAITPYGQIPDFGDAHYNSYWYLWLACLEMGAAKYRCGRMKYAAGKIYEYASSRLEGPASLYLAAFYTYAYTWGDDDVEPVRPDGQSELLLEDVIGKKISFRDGWSEDDAYLLFNYRDEGDYAYTPREYLRLTINAPAEKAHHGHADENAVLMLVKRQNVLLHDGGYRDQAPNGKYRADLYHNRLVFRQGLPDPAGGGSMYDFIHDDGTYRRVSTELLHYQSFGEIVYSRTRLRDPYRSVMWDRNMTYLRDEGVYIVVDWIVSQREQQLSTINLWHPGSVLDEGPNYYVGQVPHIYKGPGDTSPLVNRRDLALLIEFPGSVRPIGKETIRRCYGDSTMVYEADSRDAAAGEMACFVTVLTPVEASGRGADRIGRVSVSYRPDQNDQLGLVYRRPGKTTELTYKLDLDKGVRREPEDRLYPKYSWEQSALGYGRIGTDADFSFVEEDGSGPARYGFVNGCGLRLDGADVHRTPVLSYYQFPLGTYTTGDHRWRAWSGLVPEQT
ncbi:hypothetical protein [Paenibacillus sp. GCM10012303]|uniref:hypothetical protein n=1 Tax=Paenibacillus sp. GCM10012303 TaxID=3317340 RepID=UPI00361F61B5